MESILLEIFSTILIAIFTILMEGILLFLEKYSNVPIAISAILTTIATFLIWRVSSKQTEISSLMAKVAEQPIIEINHSIGDLRDYTIRMGNNFETVYGGSKQILVIQINNTGRGSAYNLEIEQRGRSREKIDTLPVGQKHEYFIPTEEIKSGEITSAVKVTYQDIFKNKFTVEK